MTAIFDSLDPHSLYISPLHIQEVNDDMAGTFVGIGIESFQFEDTVIVAHVMPDSPASMYGIKKYDKLLAIDGENVAGMQKEFDDIRKLLKTAPNKTLQVTLLRGTEKTTIQITPSEIDSPSVYSRRIKNGPVYILIEQFVSDTYR